MTDATVTPAETATPQVAAPTEPTQAAAPATPAPPVKEQVSTTAHQDKPVATDVSSLPQWAQDEIKNARAEAADRRVAAKTAAEERDALKLAVDQMTVAQRTGLSIEAVKALQGSDVDTLTAAAEAVKSALAAQAAPTPAPTSPAQLDGGVQPAVSATPDPYAGLDPLALVRELGRN